MTGLYLIAMAFCLTAAVLAFLWALTHLIDEGRRWWEDRRASKWEHQRFAQMKALIKSEER